MREDLDDIVECLRGHEHVEAAWLFGSLAQGCERPGSDLDVAVLGERPLSATDKKQLIERLARVSGRPVDLIDLQATRGPIVGRVLQDEALLFCDDTVLYAELIKRWWFDQADWLPYRRRILKDRRERWMRS
jgi:predicted nucleotidyltransferase